MGIRLTDGQSTVSRTFEGIPLHPGENVISVCAYNERGIRSAYEKIVVTSRQKPSTSNLFFLALAVNDYPGEWRLWRSVEDARALETVLVWQREKLFKEVRTRMLLDGEATNLNFNAAIHDFIRLNNKPEDVVVIFLSGHGIMYNERYYFITHEAHPKKKPYNGLNWKHFEEAIQKDLDYISKIVIINDTCYSAALTKRQRVDDRELFRELSQGSGVYHISSTSSREEAKEGLFVKVLLEGLSGSADVNGDGKINISELGFYVERTVPERSGGRMHPRVKKFEEGEREILDFPIAVR